MAGVVVDIECSVGSAGSVGVGCSFEATTEKGEMNRILHGHALDIIPTLPAGMANCVVTSPPYWAKRAYHTSLVVWDGNPNCEHQWGNKVPFAEQMAGNKKPRLESIDQSNPNSCVLQTKWGNNPSHSGQFCLKCSAWLGELGLEPTVNLYVKHLCDIFDEVKRVLRNDGVLWVVIGDTQSKGNHPIPSKCQCMVPERFSIEMVNRGWSRHSTCIWHKTNPKPESVNTRFTNDFEYVYMFVKSQKIFFDTQYEPAVCANPEAASYRKSGKSDSRGKYPKGVSPGFGNGGFWKPTKLRRMRTTFNLALQPYKGAHFAVFPEKLIEPLIKATCPLAVCSKCGRPRREIYENVKVKRKRLHDTTNRGAGDGLSPNDYAGTKRKFMGYDFCSCGAPLRRGVVFDPFMGVGTTAVVAEKLGFDWCGVELSKSYIKMAYKRLRRHV